MMVRFECPVFLTVASRVLAVSTLTIPLCGRLP